MSNEISNRELPVEETAAAQPGRRRYQLDKRLASAGQNRSRVLEAVRTILRDEGFASLTLERVGKLAGVSRQTIHNQFGSKRALLEAVFDAGAIHGRLHRLPEAFQQADVVAAAERFVQIFAEFWASDQGLTRRIHALAALHPELGELLEARAERRRQASRALITRYAPDGESGFPGASADASDALYLLTSFECYDSLAQCGRESSEVTALLVKLACSVVRA